MAAALNKIAATSPSRQHPSELETSIANALYDLESNIPDMKTALRPLQFVSAREVSATFVPSLLAFGPIALGARSHSMESLSRGRFWRSVTNECNHDRGWFGDWRVPHISYVVFLGAFYSGLA